ncbi:helix-turn-helix domain-containing protein, partial [Priestia filamentosa]|uniref:helix-turn-helix domain-containing protein n=1 Tax=Priestia filamentosa TaxID=1402861 RepID=UPI00397A9A4B
VIDGTKIKYFRQKNKISQKELAQGICSISYLSKIESNSSIPSEEILTLLCKRLGVPRNILEDPEKLKEQFYTEIEEINNKIHCNGDPNLIYEFEEMLCKYERLQGPNIDLLIYLFYLRIYLRVNNRKKATEYYQKVQSLESYIDSFSSKYYYSFCGLYHYLYGNLEIALSMYEMADKYRVEDKENILYELALVNSALGKVTNSISYVLKSLRIYTEKLDFKMCVNCNLLLGINYRKSGELNKSKHIFSQLLSKLDKTKDFNLLSKIYHNLGLTLLNLNENKTALCNFKKSLEFKPDHQKINTINLIVKSLLKERRLTEALEWLAKAQRLLDDSDNIELSIKLEVSKYFALKMEHSEEFIEFLTQKAIPFFKNKSDQDTVTEYTIYLAEAYEKRAKYKQAYLTIKDVSNIFPIYNIKI